MVPWFLLRLEVIGLTFRRTRIYVSLFLLQASVVALHWIPPIKGLHFLMAVPWYTWVIGWLTLLWFSAIEYSLERKGRFDFTSMNFFKSYLDFILNQGNRLLAEGSEKEGFYLKVEAWQRQAVEGIAIGLGPRESEKFFQKMDAQSPLTEAYKKSLELKVNEPICRALADHLEELRAIRRRLDGAEDALRVLPAESGEGGLRVSGRPGVLKSMGASNLKRRG